MSINWMSKEQMTVLATTYPEFGGLTREKIDERLDFAFNLGFGRKGREVHTILKAVYDAQKSAPEDTDTRGLDRLAEQMVESTPTPAPLPGEVEEAVKRLNVDLECADKNSTVCEVYTFDIRTILAALAALQAQLAAKDAEIAKLRKVAEAAYRVPAYNHLGECILFNDLDAALKEAGYE